jgi:hypothetical protein
MSTLNPLILVAGQCPLIVRRGKEQIKFVPVASAEKRPDCGPEVDDAHGLSFVQRLIAKPASQRLKGDTILSIRRA